MLQHRVLRRRYGPKRDEITGEWRILHNLELNDLSALLTQYFSDDKIEKSEMGGASSIYGDRRSIYSVFG